MRCLDFEDSEDDFIQKVVLQEPLVHELCNPSFITELSSIKVLNTHDILLFPDIHQGDKLKCFDITRRRWYSVKVDVVEPVPDTFDIYIMHANEGIQGKSHSNVYMIQERYTETGTDTWIYTLNLGTNVVKQSKITGIGEYELRETDMYIHDHEVVLVSQYRYETVASDDLSPIPQHLSHHTIMLYIGQIEDETTELSHILCMRKEISKVCSNGATIAMLSKNAEDLYLFNKVEFSLDVVSIKNTYNCIHSNMSMLSTSRGGFMIHDQECAVHVARLIGPSLSCNWLISVLIFRPIKDEKRYKEEYVFCENKWYCYSSNNSGPSAFSFTSHEKLIANQSREADNDGRHMEIWEPLPTHPSGHMSLPSRIFQITLPLSRLSCALNCPHCKQENEMMYSYGHHDDDSYYDDDHDYFYDDDDV